MSDKSQIKLAIDHTKVDGEDLVDFVVWLDLESDQLKDGSQFTFVGDDGEMILTHELNSYDPIKGALQAWVRVPKVSCSIDTVLYLRMNGGSESETRVVTGPWDEQARLVHAGGRLIHESDEATLSNQLTVEAWVEATDPRSEVTQTLVAQWAVQEQFGSFAAYDAGKTDGLDTTGFFGAVFDGRYVYFVPQHDLENRHGKALRFDTHGDFKNPASWEGYDASNTDGLNTKGYYGAIFDGRYIYYVPRRDEKGFHSRVLRYDTQRPFKDPSGWQAYDAGLDRSYQSAAFDGRYIYFTPGHTVVHKDEMAERPDCDSPPVTGMDPNYYLIGHSRVLRYDTQGEFKDAASWNTFDAANTDGLNTCDYDGAVFDGRYVYFSPLSTSVVLRLDTHRDFQDRSSWSAHDISALGFKLSVGGVFDGRHVYFVPYGETNHAVRYNIEKPFKDGSSWASYDVRETNELSTRGFDGAIYDGRYINYIPYYDGGVGFHGVLLRFDTRCKFTDPASWDCADGGFTDGLKTVSFNGGASDGRFLYFAAWMDGATFPKKIVGNGRILRYDTIGEQGTFCLRYCDLGHNGGLCAAVPGPSFVVNTDRGARSVRANRSLGTGRHHLVGVFDGKHLRLHVDGDLVNDQEAEGNLVANQTSMTIGSICDGTDRFRGSIEGINVSLSARTHSWIRTRFNNLRDPGAFCHRCEKN